jgi:hypothetical protein
MLMMDNESQDDVNTEILRRLKLLDSKLNFFIGVMLMGLATILGYVAYVQLAKYFSQPWDLIGGVAAFFISWQFLERPFRKAEP